MMKSLKTLFRIMDFTGPYKLTLITGMLLISADVVFSVGIVVMIQEIINLMEKHEIQKLLTLITITLTGSLVCILLMMLGSAMRKYAAVQTGKQLTLAVLERSNKLEYSYLQHSHTGDLVERINSDATNAADVIISGITPLVTNILICAAAFIYLSNINLGLTLLATATGPVTFGVGRFFDSRIRKASEEYNNSEGELRGMLQDFLGSMPIVKVLGLERVFLQKFNSVKDKQNKIVRKKALLSTVMWRSIILVNSIVIYLLAFIIAKAAIDSVISIGAVLSFLFLLGRLQWPFVNISSTWGSIQNSFGSADRVFKIFDTRIETYDDRICDTTGETAGTAAEPFINAVQIEDMSFSYDETPLFKNFNFTVKKGETVGIVGSSGSGKSTLAKLCCGLFLPEEGDIRIMGSSVRHSLAQARSRLAYVAQAPYIFTGTVGENIALGCPGSKSNKNIIETAAKMANAHSFIEAMEEGYTSNMKENGSNISGGQKQRLNIARALAKDSPLMIFDEATSALDNESEMLIQQTIDGLMGSKTLIVIAHRLTTIQNLSRIIVLDNGRIAEEGTHDELLSLKGIYHSLWSKSECST